MELHLVRHPAPLAPPGTCYGRTDLAVAPEILAAAIAHLGTGLPKPIFTSPLQRCATLAHALGSAMNCAVRVDARLAELDFGAWEMRPWDDIAHAEVDAWAADIAHYCPGGGESVLHMATRVADFYDRLQREQLARCTIICHAGSMRLLAARHRGLGPEAMAVEAAARPHTIAYCEIVILRRV